MRTKRIVKINIYDIAISNSELIEALSQLPEKNELPFFDFIEDDLMKDLSPDLVYRASNGSND